VTLERSRRLIGGVWKYVTADETSGPGGSQNLAQVLTVGNDAGALQAKNLADGTDPQDAATVAQIGGSQPAGVLALATRVFDETAGAGTYTATIAVPAECLILEMNVRPLVGPWDATTALLTVGDTPFPGGYFDDLDVQAATAFDQEFPSQGTNWFNLERQAFHPYGDGRDQVLGTNGSGMFMGIRYAAPDTITATLVTTGAGGGTGLLVLEVVGFGVPADTANAVKS
jgi:hypothetical protein